VVSPTTTDSYLLLCCSAAYGVATISRLLTIICEPYKRDCILQKRPMILRNLLIEATPYLVLHLIAIPRCVAARRVALDRALFCKRDPQILTQKRPTNSHITTNYSLVASCLTHSYLLLYGFIPTALLSCDLLPIADRMAQNLEIISKTLQLSTRRTRILMGFIVRTIYYVALIVNPMGWILVRWKVLEIISRFSGTLQGGEDP